MLNILLKQGKMVCASQLLLTILLSVASLTSFVGSLNIGLQCSGDINHELSAQLSRLNAASELINIFQIPGSAKPRKQQACSRTCESDNCSVAPMLRYGKYCGILYSGCPGEKPCDGLDVCCKQHDDCIASKNNDYLSAECNTKLLKCMKAYRKGDRPTFKGNKCKASEVVDTISVVIEAAVAAGRALHRP